MGVLAAWPAALAVQAQPEALGPLVGLILWLGGIANAFISGMHHYGLQVRSVQLTA